MNCMESQEKIIDFINDKLDIGKLVSFLDHIKNCDICREELEVYYTLFTAMQQLDEDNELSNNYSKELKKKLESIEDRIRHQKMIRFRRRFIFMFIIIGIGMLTGIEIGGKIAEDTTQKPEIRVEPTFKLTYSGIPDIMDFTESFIKEYDEKAKQYVEGRKKMREYIWQNSYMNSRGRLNYITNKDDGGSHGE